jgi:Reverse transcriptase (RNA-dependent DNA polymerase)
MPVRFENFAYSFTRKGKPVFAPSDRGRRVGEDIKLKIESAFDFGNFYYHLRRGGHVAALHAHRPNRYFARLDVERFFYSIGRNRVARVLKEIGIERADHYARWSTVKNPFNDPSYAVPYGFVQSPAIATLVMHHSPLGTLLHETSQQITVSVYVDDISISANDEQQLATAFCEIRQALIVSGFNSNEDKTREPSPNIEVFNCDLVHGATNVSTARMAVFDASEHSEQGRDAFGRYCEKVRLGND